MKVLIDTNIIISAALLPKSLPFLAFVKATNFPYSGAICEQNLVELRRVFNRKFPNRIDELNNFIACSLMGLEIVAIPTEENSDELKVRDVKDRPILRAAIAANADYILTGDNDFLEANLDKPHPISPADFLKLK